MNKQEIFNRVTEQITERLKVGVIPWKKHWKSGLPMNYITKKSYRGLNFLSLCLQDFPSPFYLTYLQCRNKKGRIMKGASGNVIIYWDVKEYVNGNEVDKDKSIRRIPFLQKSYVFNISQTDLFRPAEENPVIPSCEEIISGMKVKPVIKNNTLRCCYNVKEDFISIPPINEFDSPAEYYSSLMHELVHMSGHPSRLNRFSQEFGDDKYSSEELVAELGSAYLCALTGISSKVLENQAAYIQSWLGQLNNDPMYFINAAVAAQKAVNYILGNSEPAQSSMN